MVLDLIKRLVWLSFFPFVLLYGCEEKGYRFTYPEGNCHEDDGDASTKPCFIWIDAAANFPDFANDREKIVRDLEMAADCGFTDIVVDVRPTTGDILFRSDRCDQARRLAAYVGSEYKIIERTADWDYLQCFIDEGRKLGLNVYAAVNTFVGGNTTVLGDEGVVFRDGKMRKLATMVNTSSGIRSIMDCPNNAKFFNPVHPDVQEYICSLLDDLAGYDGLKGIILDRGRFDSFQSDFSDYTRDAFETYLGREIQSWPGDVLPAGWTSGVPDPKPLYFYEWLEFRAKTIHDFMVKARTRVKARNPDMEFGVYVGAWYSTYYDSGVNWASPDYNTSLYYPDWASAKYSDFGYADHMDVMLLGAYAAPVSVFGNTEWTMQGFCRLGAEKIMGDSGTVAGGPDVGNWDPEGKYSQTIENQAITQSVKACADACGGYFLFDMIHLKMAAQWQYVKDGINQLNSKKQER